MRGVGRFDQSITSRRPRQYCDTVREQGHRLDREGDLSFASNMHAAL